MSARISRAFASFSWFRTLKHVNFVMVGDHGMTEVGAHVDTNFLYLDLYLSPLLAERIIDRGAYTQIIPRASTRQQILNELASMPNVTVYTRDEFPTEWHYATHSRIPEILVLADPGSVIVGTQTDNMLPRDPPGAWDGTRGIHGYTRNMTDMATVFYARGPGFRRNYTQDPMELVDIYQVLAHQLDIEPRPHNGTWDTVKHMFSPAPALRPALGGAVLLAQAALAALVAARVGTWV
ncbi:Ectonucleotide pyrophosphatase/phosphodiesterase family member 5 [Amphibalanus amphitrite]|uniref:Ectonucleotide pyrophosphatase/phosphodiesterase family member 5 n=1 Tax=Amphibalanus amphitrite TaxID=1232801 RepID=A0A6A4V996_AMPAM|nr:Ectonucleotide pyrophosphatase/phosphodiesterase family member 5 [Amphibalanus amphitrite]